MRASFSLKNIAAKIYKTFRIALPKILFFEILFKAFTAIFVMPLLSGIMSFALEISGRSFVANSSIISFLLSPVGIILAIFLIIFAVFFVYIEFSVLIIIIYYGYNGKKIKIKHALKLAMMKIHSLINIQILAFAVYTLLLLPLANMGIVSSILPYLDLPNFVVTSLSQTFGGALLIFIFSAVIIMIGSQLAYALPIMVLENIPFMKAAVRSKVVMKKTSLKLALMEILFFLVWLMLTIVPLMILVVILEFKDVIAFNMSDILLNFGISWYTFICFVSFGLMWVLENFFMPMILTVMTVAYLELDGSLASVDEDKLPIEKKSILHKRFFGLPSISSVWIKIIRLSFFKKYEHVFVAVFFAITLVLVANAIDTVVDTYMWPVPQTDPIVMGHRGSLKGVENTLEAIQGAIDDGADYVEIDVQLSKDGIPVVVHDTNLSRLVGEKLTVYDHTAEELSKMVLKQNEFQGRISTLQQVIEYCKGKIKLNIELKQHGYENEDLVKKVMEVVENEKFQDDCVFQSLTYDLVQHMKEEYPENKVGYIVYGNLGTPDSIGIMRLNVDFLVMEEGFTSQKLVKACRKANVKLFVWTVNNEEEMLRFLRMGVDGIITDEPDLAQNKI